LALAPGNPRAWHGLGLIQQQLEDLESARASMEQMVALSPKSLGLRVNIAWFYLDIGETEQAWELVHEVLADDPDYSDALFLRALMLNDIGEDRRALADIERILNRVPNHLPAHWLRAQSMLALGELNATRDSAESVLRIDASFYDVHRILLLAALEEEDFEAAEHQLELWQEKVPEDEMDYQLLGSMQQTLGLYEDAIATYTLGLEIVGELDAFYFNRGLSYLNLSDVEPQYEADFEKVLQLSHDLDLLSEAEYWLVSYVLTTSSTDGIVTVVDEELGYTINYSEAWSQVPLAPNSGTDLSLEWIFDEGYATIEIRHFVEADDLTVDDAVELVNAEVNNIPEFETLAIESLSIAGVDARKRIYEFTFEGDAGQPVVLAGRQYYVVNDGILWIITAEIEADFIADFEAEFDMVINSFTFLP
jgi:Flp pilus assembly protein TadD